MAQHYDSIYEHQEKECLKFANCLIEKCRLSLPAVRCLKDINCNLIVSLYENITGLTILDLLSCENAVDEAHNVQAVIDALSLDLLGISLSHITGEDVVAGDVTAIYNLLEILEGIFLLTSGGKNSSTSSSYSVSSKKGIKRKISRLSSRKQKLQPESVEFAETNENLRNKLDSSFTSFGSTHSYASTSSSLEHEKEKSPVRSRDIYADLFAGHKILHPKRVQRKLNSIEISSPPSVDDVTSSVHSKLVSKVLDDPFQRSERGKKTKKEEQQQFVESPSVLNLIHTARKNKDSGSSQIRTKKAKTADPFHLKEDKRLQKKGVEELYEKNLENKIRLFLEKNSPVTKYASQTKKRYLKQMKKPMHRSSIKPCRKSFLLPHSLRHRTLSHTSAKEFHSLRCQLDGNVGKDAEKIMPKESAAFIEELKQEFPGVPLSPDTLKRISKTYNQHLMTMHKQLKDCLLKKSRVQVQAEEAAKRQALLSKILQKEIQETQQLKDVKQHKETENKIKYQLRDARLRSAKLKEYCKEFQDEMRKKMQKRNFTEELIVENAFKEALNIEKEQVQNICKDVKEAEGHDARQHQKYIDAMENLYETQFSLLAESLAIEKKDAEERLKAQKKVMRMMQQEFRENLKKEIREMQKNTVEIMQDTHFRELDAEQYKAKMSRKFR